MAILVYITSLYVILIVYLRENLENVRTWVKLREVRCIVTNIRN